MTKSHAKNSGRFGDHGNRHVATLSTKMHSENCNCGLYRSNAMPHIQAPTRYPMLLMVNRRDMPLTSVPSSTAKCTSVGPVKLSTNPRQAKHVYKQTVRKVGLALFFSVEPLPLRWLSKPVLSFRSAGFIFRQQFAVCRCVLFYQFATTKSYGRLFVARLSIGPSCQVQKSHQISALTNTWNFQGRNPCLHYMHIVST